MPAAGPTPTYRSCPCRRRGQSGDVGIDWPGPWSSQGNRHGSVISGEGCWSEDQPRRSLSIESFILNFVDGVVMGGASGLQRRLFELGALCPCRCRL